MHALLTLEDTPSQPSHKPNHIEVPSNRFDHVYLDLVQLRKVGELRYCFTIIDRFSRRRLAIPLSNMLAVTVASAFYMQWICQFGTPLTMTTDQGSQFESRFSRRQHG